jgi:hypothetical protein
VIARGDDSGVWTDELRLAEERPPSRSVYSIQAWCGKAFRLRGNIWRTAGNPN